MKFQSQIFYIFTIFFHMSVYIENNNSLNENEIDNKWYITTL